MHRNAKSSISHLICQTPNRLQSAASISNNSAGHAGGTSNLPCVTQRRVCRREDKYMSTTRMSCENANNILRSVSTCPPAALLLVASSA